MAVEIKRVTGGQVSRVSLVENAANMETICSEVFCNIDDDFVTVVVLKANQLIYREAKDNENEYFFFMEEDIVEKLAHDFLERNMNDSLSLDHLPFTDVGIRLAESYVAGGVWRMKLHVTDKEIMARIHQGSLTGASIESINTLVTILTITDDYDKFIADARALDDNTKSIIFDNY